MPLSREVYFALVISDSLGVIAVAKYEGPGVDKRLSAGQDQFLKLTFDNELIGFKASCLDGIYLPSPESFECKHLKFIRPVELEEHHFNDQGDDENGTVWRSLKGVTVPVENGIAISFKVKDCTLDLNVNDISQLFVCKASDQDFGGNDVIYTIFDEFRGKDDSLDIEISGVEVATFKGIPEAVAEVRRKFENAIAQLKEFEDRANAMQFSDPEQDVRLYWDTDDNDLVLKATGETSGISDRALSQKLGDYVMENIYKQVRKLKLLAERKSLEAELANLNQVLSA